MQFLFLVKSRFSGGVGISTPNQENYISDLQKTERCGLKLNSNKPELFLADLLHGRGIYMGSHTGFNEWANMFDIETKKVTDLLELSNKSGAKKRKVEEVIDVDPDAKPARKIRVAKEDVDGLPKPRKAVKDLQKAKKPKNVVPSTPVKSAKPKGKAKATSDDYSEDEDDDEELLMGTRPFADCSAEKYPG